ncbi:PREDICTED: uncharacterized protein LOC104760909 [Camelina sativa]|uniref:Uncharacterized protein LOC104760909 n=1 Tax=Camelina sativa TaxID=90675 RepID=A0ABM0X8B7_CAMSA|nr:PREDICTED: uncharacterized protein LOC104760909 [Camelina sativa]
MNVENISRENVASHLQKFRMGMKKGNEKIKNEETTNLALITPQEGIMYVGADASQYFREKNFQLPTHHVNNIPQPTYVPQHTTNPNNLMTHLISPLEHHYDEAFVAVSGRGLVMNHQYHNHHQTSDFTVEETFGYKNFQEEEEPTVASLMLTPNPKHVELYPCQPEYNSMEIRNNHEVGTSSSMLHLPQLISSPRTYSLEQHESGGFSYNSDITGSINYSKSA